MPPPARRNISSFWQHNAKLMPYSKLIFLCVLKPGEARPVAGIQGQTKRVQNSSAIHAITDVKEELTEILELLILFSFLSF